MSLDSALMYLGFAATSATLFSAGVITTATFTVMMSVSKSAGTAALADISVVGDLAGTHYTVLATAEILGKLVRNLGYAPNYIEPRNVTITSDDSDVEINVVVGCVN